MRRLIEATFVSLDGVIKSQEKWALPYFSGESKSEALAELASVDTFPLGRETYQKFAALVTGKGRPLLRSCQWLA
jgi:hypothetical protein